MGIDRNPAQCSQFNDFVTRANDFLDIFSAIMKKKKNNLEKNFLTDISGCSGHGSSAQITEFTELVHLANHLCVKQWPITNNHCSQQPNTIT